MKTFPNRVTVYVKDIMLITGQSERTARRLMKKIREKFNVGNTSFVSVDDFCSFTGLREEKVREFLK